MIYASPEAGNAGTTVDLVTTDRRSIPAETTTEVVYIGALSRKNT